MVTGRTPLTAKELEAVAYFAVGVTSEGSIAGRDVSYRLSFAGNVGAGGRMQPVANSGYSFGTLQIDLGQHPEVARALLDGYQAWAALQPDRDSLELGCTGTAMGTGWPTSTGAGAVSIRTHLHGCATATGPPSSGSRRAGE